MAKTTFVVPVYNVEDYAGRCLDSLMKQTCKDFTVFCVNDGSTDGSRDIILDYVNKDKRFVLLDKENGGLSDARNYGLKKVESEYVIFIDGDDFVEDKLLEKTIPLMEKDKLDMLVFGYNQYYLEDGHIENNHLGINDGIYNLNENKELLALTPNAAWNKVYRTELFRNNGIEYPFGYRHQDMGTTPKLLLLSKKIGYLNECLYNYIIDRPNNITAQIDNKLYHIIDMADEVIDYYREQNRFEDYKNEFNYLVKRNFIQSLRKSMKLKDREFVFKFIDDIFDMEEKNFKGCKDTYKIEEVKSDRIYMNRFLCKLYYLYRHRGD